MRIALHPNATTTLRIRAAIQASDEPASVLAERHGVSISTIYAWRDRDSTLDRSHTPHRLQTTLSQAQEAVAVELRRTLGLPLDDLLAVVREFLHPQATRSGLHRCLKRHGVSVLAPREPPAASTGKAFKTYEPGYLHMDVKYLPQMPDEPHRRYLFVAIDRATRWVFLRIYPANTAANARRFLNALAKACPLHIRTILTDNGNAFTDRLFGTRARQPSGEHEFDRLCAALGIEHRLTPVRRPQTNGMVERFNGRISEVLATHRFHGGEELQATLERYLWLYNHHLPQKALAHVSPIEAMKRWQTSHPHLFHKKVVNQPGPDS
jgi:transposase InsO family protein